MRLLCAALLLLLSLTAQGEEGSATISEIQFYGNVHTKESVLLQEMSIHVGDPVDIERIEKSRQAIMNLGLFKSVLADLEEGNILVITVVERYYVLPLPLLDVRPEGNYSYGVELRLDNLAGLNQRFKLTYEEKDSFSEDIPHSKEAGISYIYPRIIDTPYQLEFSSKLKRTELNWPNDMATLGHYRLDSWVTQLGASRWLNDDGASRGWRYGGGVSHLYNDFVLLSGTPGPYADGEALGLYLNLDYHEVDDHNFYREGRTYGVQAEVGSPLLGSDFSYSREQFYYRSYRYLPSNGANVNTQWRFGYAGGCRFGCAAYFLGSGTTLRGYDDNYVSGNIYALLNLEYHHPMTGYRQLRGVLFTDVGDAWSDLESVTLNELKSSVGLGLRWTVQSFVDLTLRYDFAYALDSGTRKGYFSTRASF